MKKSIRTTGALAVAAIALGTASVASAGSSDPGAAQRGDAAATKALARSGAAGAAAAVTPLRCDGRAQKAVHHRIVNQPFTVGELPDFSYVPGTTLAVAGPSTYADVVSVTFSGEGQLRGTTDLYDWAQLEVTLDGVPMQPTDPGSPLALFGSPTYGSFAAQFCAPIRSGTHVIRVRTKTIDNGTDNALSSWLDDYVLKAEISD